MSIKSTGNRTIRIIDRILREIESVENCTLINDVLGFCRILKQAGVDMLEVDSGLGEDVYRLLPEVEFIFRVRSLSDIPKLLEYGLKHCIVDLGMVFEGRVLEELTTYGINITVEIGADGLEDILEINKITELHNVDCIRIMGLNKMVSSDWVEAINQIKYHFKVMIDLCPQNRYHSANAFALEALVNGTDILTTSFIGFGGENGFASTEGVLAAVKNILYPENNMNLINLVKLGYLFERISGVTIPQVKPIIGKDVFKYESGIHADGIEKNPTTYEPFDPGTVGQDRKLVIGKHSGKKAIQSKLKELNMACDSYDLEYLLEMVRERSINMGRGLYDRELVELLECKPVSGF